ncbi:MAG: hypothetical protein WCL37_00155 [Chrysiogenales bacterium]
MKSEASHLILKGPAPPGKLPKQLTCTETRTWCAPEGVTPMRSARMDVTRKSTFWRTVSVPLTVALDCAVALHPKTNIRAMSNSPAHFQFLFKCMLPPSISLNPNYHPSLFLSNACMSPIGYVFLH